MLSSPVPAQRSSRDPDEETAQKRSLAAHILNRPTCWIRAWSFLKSAWQQCQHDHGPAVRGIRDNPWDCHSAPEVVDLGEITAFLPPSGVLPCQVSPWRHRGLPDSELSLPSRDAFP